MKTLMIWDIDGTILDCKGCGRSALSETFRRLYGYEDAFVDVDLTGKIDRQIIEEVVQHHAIKDFRLENFLHHYGEVLNDVMHKLECIYILNGVKDVLNFYSNKKDYYLSIATGNCRTGAMGKLGHCGAQDYFETGAYGDEAYERSELIAMAIDKASNYYHETFDRARIFYLGDTPKDIEAAKMNGINSVAVSTGVFTHDALKNHQPHFLLESLEDLEQVQKIFSHRR
jgi:phosphoglycolate phosphatase-like HAD superfamily hydrolase